MYSNNAYNTYKNNSVNYASKEQLLLLLLDGAVRFTKVGRQALMDNDIAKANDNIKKVQSIFYELIATLDLSKAGDWGPKLVSVYKFIIDRLIQANIRKDEKIMEELLPLIEEVRDTWQEVYYASKR
jgi:flagellar biosynthetic protein FliS